MPISKEMNTAVNPTPKLIAAPAMSRLSTSRPYRSVPNQKVWADPLLASQVAPGSNKERSKFCALAFGLASGLMLGPASAMRIKTAIHPVLTSAGVWRIYRLSDEGEAEDIRGKYPRIRGLFQNEI